VDFAFSEEQEEFRQTLRRFFEAVSPFSEVQRLMEAPEPFDRGVWKQMGEELGLQGVHIPEKYGGQGFGFLELGIVFEEMGRTMFCSPYFSSIALAANAILNAGSEADCQRWLPELASGETIGTLALLDDGDHWDAASVSLEAARDRDAWVLSGRKRLVTAGPAARLVVVAARLPGTRGEDGIGLFVVRSDAAGYEATPLEAIDPTRPLADIEFDGVRAAPLGEPGSAGAALERTLDQGRVCLAIEAAGGAARCLECAVAYAKQRIQFGRPIGSFQAVKHTCAVDLLEVESAKSVAYWACWVAENSADELAEAASVAKSVCDDAYARTSDDNVHLHGGIGVTWEASPHLFFKRAKADQILLGDPRWQRARIASQQGF